MIDEDELCYLLQNKTSVEKGFRVLVEKYQERLYWSIRAMVFIHSDVDKTPS